VVEYHIPVLHVLPFLAILSDSLATSLLYPAVSLCLLVLSYLLFPSVYPSFSPSSPAAALLTSRK
jgi:hypothetical protein